MKHAKDARRSILVKIDKTIKEAKAKGVTLDYNKFIALLCQEYGLAWRSAREYVKIGRLLNNEVKKDAKS